MDLQIDAYHHGDLRNAMVAAATKLVKQGGEEAFSLREAARDVGVTANAAYRHFASKSDLTAAVAAQGFENLARRMRKAMEAVSRRSGKDVPSIARFKAVGRAYVEFALDNPRLFRLMFGEQGICCLHGETKQQRATATPTPYELLGQSLDELVAGKLLAPRMRPGAELKAWSLVHGFASLALDGRALFTDRRGRSAALESMLDFAVAGLCRAQGAS
jgi:AcrR family transcriptional regulator